MFRWRPIGITKVQAAYLLKTNSVYVDQYGTAVTTDVTPEQALVNNCHQQEGSAVEALPAVKIKRYGR